MWHPENILVVRLSSLGDIIMTLPAVCSLKNHFPRSRIQWVCEGSADELLSCMEFIDEVIKFPRGKIVGLVRAGKIAGAVRVFKDFFSLMRKKEFDLVIDFHGILKSALISVLTRRKKLIGFGRPYAKEFSHIFYDEKINGTDPFLHKVERNMMIVRHLGAMESFNNLAFRIPKKDEEYIENFFRKEGIGGTVFVVNPFSSKKGIYKRWPLESYGVLINRIHKEIGAQIVIPWGTEDEKKEAERLKKDLKTGVIVCWPTNLPQLLALFSRTHMYIGGDSGLTHLASLTHTPVVAIFGPSDHRVNSPYAATGKIIRKEIPCGPCKKRDCKDRKCLTQIDPEYVFDVVESLYRERLVKN